MPDLVGRTLGPYRIVEQIGLGGMATVYKAYQPSMDRYVALKVLSTHLTQDATFVKRFQQEAKVIAKLEHLHILPVHDHGQEDGYLYLVMRFIEAGTLKDRLRGGPLSLSEVRHIVSQVGSALEYAHQLGVVHRDIKPSNVLIDRQGDCYLTDFGIAKMAEGTLGLTGSGIIGTPHYMAPEQGQSLKVDHRADIYAMGVVIYEMVTGRVPYDAETPIAVVMKHITEPLPLPRSLRPDLPEAVERVILKALAKAPADRTQSMRDLVAAFDEAVSAAPTEAGAATATAQAVPPPTPIEEGKAGPTAVVPGPATASIPARRRWATVPAWLLAAAGLALVVLALAGLALAGLMLSRIPGQVEVSRGPAQAVLPTLTATPAVAAVIPATPTPQPPTTMPAPTLSAGSTKTRSADGMVMVYVPAGEFAMGSTDAQVEAAWQACKTRDSSCERGSFEDELPQHRATLDAFWVDRTEVTNAQYARCVAAGVCRPPSRSNSYIMRESYYGDSQYDEYPVIYVDWNDATTYCEWAGGRLPSEAEWEYAARGPDGHIYPWGNGPPDETLLNYDRNVNDTTKAGSYPKGQSWVGALDMAGNVWEWVNDWHGSYPSEPQVNPTGPPSGVHRVLRGSSGYASDVHAAIRGYNLPDVPSVDMGFRCVVAPSITQTPTVTAMARTPSPTPTPQPPTAVPTPTPSTGSTKTRSADGMVMVYVPAGEFAMGSTDAQVEAAWQACKTRDSSCERGSLEDESPQHRVTLDAFWIDRTEVTNAQYARCVAAGVCRVLWHPNTVESYYGDSQYDEYPVVWMDWNSAATYCEWAGGRLPSEAEWEYAARGPDGHIYPWGNDPPDDTLLNYDKPTGHATKVGSYPKGQSWAGALDMAGNAWESVNDGYNSYPSEPQVNPTGPASGPLHVVRGGSWLLGIEYARAASRDVISEGGARSDMGVRCVVAPSITETPTVTALARPPSPTPTPQPPTAMPTPTPSTGSTKTRSADGMVMVYVPAGSFPMGSTDAQVEAVWQACKTRDSTCERSGMFEGELPQHRVTLDAFWIDRTEVTNAQYARCVAAGVCRPPSESGSRTRESYYENSQYDEYPVILVSWDEATTYCRWAGGRLPSEAEWEYAARGPEGRVYPWGNQFDGAKLNYCVANCQLDGYSDTAPVGSYPGGASWVGALDMAGNVWEWVNDWNGNYPSEPQVNPGGPASGTHRIMRGGGWFDDPDFVRAATRVVGLPVGTYDHVGVRCVVAPGS